MLIRMENQEDRTAIHAINEMAFESPAEANLVDALREQVELCISLVAEQDGEIVGHIMFSPVALSDHSDLKIMAWLLWLLYQSINERELVLNL